MKMSRRAKRMDRRHKRGKGSTALNLVSLMDIFTILVFFLLVSSTESEVLPNAKEVQLPESIAERKAEETVVVMITEKDILVQGIAVATVSTVNSQKGNVIEPLKAALLVHNERERLIVGETDIEQRAVTIMGDREIPYSLLKKVMATCTDADYGRISLAVLQKASDLQMAQGSTG